MLMKIFQTKKESISAMLIKWYGSIYENNWNIAIHEQDMLTRFKLSQNKKTEGII